MFVVRHPRGASASGAEEGVGNSVGAPRHAGERSKVESRTGFIEYPGGTVTDRLVDRRSDQLQGESNSAWMATIRTAGATFGPGLNNRPTPMIVITVSAS